ncbi:helix-turn-helix domain-containing protein [Streptococcus thermophilus]|nr:helix-turn-helix domain-containing protein [Streptococcus thermophilus]MDA5540637.1 helix-turn-helix domain-containing protein [Streptococcus thermophilus]
MSYHHFTIEERESILVYRTQGLNLSQIAKLLHRYPSSISREWKRYLREGNYSPCHAQKSYYIAKSHCGRKRILEIDRNLSNTVRQTSISRVSMVS